MKLQILVPQYNETENIICNLLNSLEMQQGIKMDSFEVLIANDGSNHLLNEKNFLKKYSYSIQYFKNKHKGIAGTRNFLLNKATADYIMFCDADDMFFNMRAIAIILEQINNKKDNPIELMTSDFYEEVYNPSNDTVGFLPYENDYVHIHGKVYNRNYLIKNKIYFPEELDWNEDHFFNKLVFDLLKNGIKINEYFYLWKRNVHSETRQMSESDTFYKDKCSIVESEDILLTEMLNRGMTEKGRQSFLSTVFFIYFHFMTNGSPSQLEENEKRTEEYYIFFKKFMDKYKDLYNSSTIEQILEAKKGQIEVNKFSDKNVIMSYLEWMDIVNQHIEENK